jgi:hypothetical protein
MVIAAPDSATNKLVFIALETKNHEPISVGAGEHCDEGGVVSIGLGSHDQLLSKNGGRLGLSCPEK